MVKAVNGTGIAKLWPNQWSTMTPNRITGVEAKLHKI